MWILRRTPVALLLSLYLLLRGADATADVRVTVDFGKPSGKVVDGRQYGLNLFHIYDPAVAISNQTYRSQLAAMHPGLVRIHSWEMITDSSNANGWVLDAAKATYRWDAAKIKQSLGGSLAWKPAIIMNIPAWPAFLGPNDKPLDLAKVDAFAAFCASLVQIVNLDAKLGVRYWEITNERDSVYKGQEAAYAALYGKVARAMKAVDATIKVGGPALSQPWAPAFDGFVKGAAADLDFFSYHTYSTGDRNAAVPGLYKTAYGLGGIVADVKGRLAKVGRGDIELFHDEYNISWSPPDVRMTNEIGAVFDALALASFAEAGIAGAAAWNEADGWFGKLDASYKPRPGADVFALFNNHMLGNVVLSSSSSVETVTAFAVASAEGSALALINRSTVGESVAVVSSGPRVAGAHWQGGQVTALGLGSLPAGPATAVPLVLPASSVTVLWEGEAAGGTGVGPVQTSPDAGGDATAPRDASSAPPLLADAALAAGEGLPDAAAHGGTGGSHGFDGGPVLPTGTDDESPPRGTARASGCQWGGGRSGDSLALLATVVASLLWRRRRTTVVKPTTSEPPRPPHR